MYRQNPRKARDEAIEKAARALYEHDLERSGKKNPAVVFETRFERVAKEYRKQAEVALDAAGRI